MNKRTLPLVGASLLLALSFLMGADPAASLPNQTVPANNLLAVTLTSGVAGSDANDLPVVARALYIGGAGNVVAIGASDGVTENGASAANAATLTVNTGGNIPAYSSTIPGQYIICADGTHAAEIISGYLTGTTLTVTSGGGSGANTTANAHNSGTLIAAYAPLNSANAGTPLPIRTRRIMYTNTTATGIVELY